MNKKIIGIILTIIVIIIVSMGLLNNNKKQKVLEPIIEMTDEELEIKTYADPSGFSFEYPDTVIVSPQQNVRYYALIEITAKNKTGDIIIRIFDDTDKAVVGRPIDPIGPSPTPNTQLGGLPAYQKEENGKITTIALDKDVIFSIIVNPQNNSEFWEKINNAIISSFAFIQTEQPTQSPQQNSSESSGGTSDETESGVEEIL